VKEKENKKAIGYITPSKCNDVLRRNADEENDPKWGIRR
jgi:hypothetical protein